MAKYKFTDKVPFYKVEKFSNDPEKPGFVIGFEPKQGVQAFGPQTGLIYEDQLTDAIVDFLSSKTDGTPDNKPMYAGWFEKASESKK